MYALRHAALLVLLAASACRGGHGPTPTLEPRPGPNSPITEEEIERAHSPDLLTLVRARRPQWLNRKRDLTVRGDDEITVYLNDTRVGGLRELRTMPTVGVQLVSWLTPAQAQYRYGVGNVNGAIVILSNRGEVR